MFIRSVHCHKEYCSLPHHIGELKLGGCNDPLPPTSGYKFFLYLSVAFVWEKLGEIIGLRRMFTVEASSGKSWI